MKRKGVLKSREGNGNQVIKRRHWAERLDPVAVLRYLRACALHPSLPATRAVEWRLSCRLSLCDLKRKLTQPRNATWLSRLLVEPLQDQAAWLQVVLPNTQRVGRLATPLHKGAQAGIRSSCITGHPRRAPA